MLTGAHILLTGGAGFIGTALTRLLAPNNKVRILDNLRRNALAAAGLSDHPNVELIVGDVRDAELMHRATKGADYVIHMASIAGVDTVLKNPVLTMEVSLEGTMNALRAARDAGGVKRFIDFSTSEVFGTYAFRVREADVTSLGAVGEARWTYAVSKLATEHLAHNYWKQFQLPTCSIRPFNIYGPGQVGEGAVHAFVVRALEGTSPSMIHNEGDQIRAWCYIDDIVESILLALTQGRGRRAVVQHRQPAQHGDDLSPGQARRADRQEQIGNSICALGFPRRRAPRARHQEGRNGARLRAEGGPRRGPRTHRRVVPRPSVTASTPRAIATCPCQTPLRSVLVSFIRCS
jgi:nucleoside-diphosphate-sugar epimerase